MLGNHKVLRMCRNATEHTHLNNIFYGEEWLREGCKFTHLGGWVVQEWDKLHRKNKKKHAFKIHFRPF